MRKFSVIFIVFALLMLGSTAFAHTVKMNFRFNISKDDIRVNDTTYSSAVISDYDFGDMEKKYIASNDSNKVAALVFAGSKLLNIGFTAYSNSYNFEMNQEENGNRVLLVFTEGTWKNVDEKIFSVGKLLSRTFGNFAAPAPEVFSIFLRLEYENINILNSFRLGKGSHDLLIKNLGENEVEVIG